MNKSDDDVFTFKKGAHQEFLLPDSNILMKTVRCDKAVARLMFFVSGEEIDVPNEVEVFNITDLTAPEKLTPSRSDYALGWTDTYQIVYRGEILLVYSCQRHWVRQVPKTKTSSEEGDAQQKRSNRHRIVKSRGKKDLQLEVEELQRFLDMQNTDGLMCEAEYNAMYPTDADMYSESDEWE